MKNVLIGVVVGFVVLGLFSYTDTRGIECESYNPKPTVIVPLKQTGVTVTTDLTYVNKLIEKGWVVQDVDVIWMDSPNRATRKFYTLIRY